MHAKGFSIVTKVVAVYKDEVKIVIISIKLCRRKL